MTHGGVLKKKFNIGHVISRSHAVSPIIMIIKLAKKFFGFSDFEPLFLSQVTLHLDYIWLSLGFSWSKSLLPTSEVASEF
jgi:hypothetical protein